MIGSSGAAEKSSKLTLPLRRHLQMKIALFAVLLTARFYQSESQGIRLLQLTDGFVCVTGYGVNVTDCILNGRCKKYPT